MPTDRDDGDGDGEEEEEDYESCFIYFDGVWQSSTLTELHVIHVTYTVTHYMVLCNM